MKITEVSYRALRTGRGYNNTSAEAKAEVEDGETPESVLARLRQWVDGQIDETLKRDDAYEKLSEINERLGDAQRDLERVEKRAKEARAFIAECREIADIARREGKGGMALLLENVL